MMLKIKIILSIIPILWILSYPAQIFISGRIGDLIGEIREFLVEQIFSFPIYLSKVWDFSAATLYAIGNFFVLLLLIVGGLIFSYSIYSHIDTFQFTLSSLYQLARELIDEKVAGSAATMLIAATVALGHMWKLVLDKREYFERRLREHKKQRRHRESTLYEHLRSFD